MNNFPYEKRVASASFTMHKTEAAFLTAVKYRSQIPADALYYFSKVFGSKQKKANAISLRKTIA